MKKDRHAWVRERLHNWAAWVSERTHGGLGYPKQAPFARMRVGRAGDGGVFEAHIPVDAIAAREVEDAMQRLRFANAAQYVAIMCRYHGNPFDPPRRRRPLQVSAIARVMSVAESTVYAHLDAGHVALSDMLGQRRRGGFTE